MGVTTTANAGVNHEGRSVLQVSTGSVKSDWQLANSSLQTVNTDVLLNLGSSTVYTTPIEITVPAGVTRAQMRAAVPVDATTFTTAAVVVLVGADANGIPQRIDAPDDSNATGVTLTLAASGVFTADGKYWSEVTEEYDLRGSTKIYMLVATAAAITDGTDAVVAEGRVRFLN